MADDNKYLFLLGRQVLGGIVNNIPGVGTPISGVDMNYPDLQGIELEVPLPNATRLDTKIYDNVTLQRLNPLLSITINGIAVKVSQTKNIVKTTVEGLNGTVKEYISMGDYEIELAGTITNPKGKSEYPKDEVATLIELCTLSEPIDLICKHVQQFDISSAVVVSYEMPQKAGAPFQQEFTIKLVSDIPDVIKLLQK